jgi:hypothetical protein
MSAMDNKAMTRTMNGMERAPAGRGEQRGGGRERGAALVVALFLITVLTVLGVLVLNTSIVETKMANNQKISSQAFYAAEAGLERVLAKVMRDYEDDSSSGSPWGNNIFAGADTVGVTVRATGSPAFSVTSRTLDMWLSSPNVRCWSFTCAGGRGGTSVGRASYRIFSYAPSANEIFFLSYATQPDAVAAVEYHLKVDDMSPYNNAIFIGSGLSGIITGNVSVHGSVYANGNLTLGGVAQLSNNYTGDAGNHPQGAIGSPPFGFPNNTDLKAKIRIKGGDLTLGSGDAGADAGHATVAGEKHTLAGVYVDGSIPAGKVFADEVSNVVPNIPMPDILDGLKAQFGETFINTNFPGTSSTVRARQAYTALASGTGAFAVTPPMKSSTGFVVNRNLILSSSGTASFTSLDGLGNGIIWNKTARTLQIIGNVVVNGTLDISGVTYTCKGAFTSNSTGGAVAPANQNELGAMIYCTKKVTVDGGFTPPPGSGYLQGGANTNSLGIATPDNLFLSGSPGSYFTGFYYAQGQFDIQKQMKLLGTVICGTGNFKNVPDLYQVPQLENYLPEFMPGGQNMTNFSNREWRRVY